MTREEKLDMFASAALTGLIAGGYLEPPENTTQSYADRQGICVEKSFDIAEEMLAESERRNRESTSNLT